MTVSPSLIDGGRTPAEILAEQRMLAIPTAPALIRKLGQQAAELHGCGRDDLRDDHSANRPAR